METVNERIIHEARRLLEWGNREAARRRLAQAVQADSSDPELWYWLAHALDEPGHAREALERALALEPGYGAARTYLQVLERDASLGSVAAPPALPVGSPDFGARSTEGKEPPDEPEPTSQDEPHPAITLDWLEDEAEPAPSPVAHLPVPDPAPKEGTWGLLDELGTGDVAPPPDDAPHPAPESRSEAALWSLLHELEEADPRPPTRDSQQAGATHDSASELQDSSPAPTPLTEAELWARAARFVKSTADEGAGAGAFAAPNTPSAPPSVPPASSLPTSTRAMWAADDDEEAEEAEPIPSITAKKQAMTQGSVRAKPPRRGRAWLRSLLLLLIVGVLAGLVWYALRFNRVPTAVRAVNPAIATQVLAAHLRLAPPPTALPVPDWVGEAHAARYANRLNEAEQVLRTGLAAEPDNVAAQLALSDLLRERPGGEAEALDLASRAQDLAASAAGSLEERAWAAEGYVWALALQSEVDTANTLARAEEATFYRPGSAHAQWAYAMALAIAGEPGGARSAAALAAALSPRVPAGWVAARQAAVFSRAGEQEQAAQQYARALAQTDYVPWRVALVTLLRDLGRPEEAQAELDHLLDLAPDDPAVQALQQP